MDKQFVHPVCDNATNRKECRIWCSGKLININRQPHCMIRIKNLSMLWQWLHILKNNICDLWIQKSGQSIQDKSLHGQNKLVPPPRNQGGGTRSTWQSADTAEFCPNTEVGGGTRPTWQSADNAGRKVLYAPLKPGLYKNESLPESA